MGSDKGIQPKIAEARQLEKDGQLAEAANIYQTIFNGDGSNLEVIARLLVNYRKLKEYKKELAVLEDAIAASAARDKAARLQWIKTHPKAATTGRAMLKQMERGGAAASGFGLDPIINSWRKRIELVTRRITGKKAKPLAKPAAAKREETAARRQRQNTARQQATAARKEAAAAKRNEQALERKAAAADLREKKLVEKKAAAKKKAAAEEQKKAALVAKMHPSLFIITIRYLAPLEKIDAAMPQHMAFLDKHYTTGDFIVSGRQVPRTGGIILARGKDRRTVERLAKQDPFVKKKLAAIDIIEFSASQMAKGLSAWLKSSA